MPSFGPGVCAELANRGIKDVLIVCRDGLTGFPEAIEATWPNSTVQPLSGDLSKITDQALGSPDDDGYWIHC